MFSTTCKYGIRAVLYLAIKSTNDSKIGVDELADTLCIPKHFLAKILQVLTKNKVVSSSKGRHGGFYLKKRNKQINLMKIIEVLDGTNRLTCCILGLETCDSTHACPYHNIVQQFRNDFYQKLENETIGEAAQRIDEHDFNLKNL